MEEITTSVRAKLEAFLLSHWRSNESAAPVDFAASLFEQGVIDSLMLIRLLDFIQQQFAVTIEAGDVVREHFETVDAMSALVARLQNSVP